MHLLVCYLNKLQNARCNDKDVEFYSENKFEKLVHLVGFIIRIYHDARSSERQVSVGYPS